jgi:hypothetical protein
MGTKTEGRDRINNQGGCMFLVRDIMYCKPGNARPMVDKFLAVAAISQKLGMGPVRVMTDVSAEQYWTVISEMEVSSLDALSDRAKAMADPDFQAAMAGYHDLIDHGRREIYAIER